jgi:UDP-N-acetylmuramate--alanine ligase
MQAAGLDPTYVIGGRLAATGDNVRLGESPFLVAEADESDGSFLRLSPVIAIVSNIDPEHLDHYGDFESLMASFREFVYRVPFYGRVVLHHEHPHVCALRDGLHKPVTTYGSSPQADIHLLEARSEREGQHFQAGTSDGQSLGEFFLPIPGRHNAENALAAIAVLRELGISTDEIRNALASFRGIERRFQCTAAGRGILVDDYAHHPAEILATLEAARQCWPSAGLTVIFQPHRYSRSRDLMHEFFGAFDQANTVALLPIYAASEAPISGISSSTMVDGIMRRGHRNVQLCDDFDQARTIVIKALNDGQVVLMMGAGSIGQLAADIRQQLEEKAA